MAPSFKHLMPKVTWGNGQGSGSSVLCKPKSGLMTAADNLYKTLQAKSGNQHDNCEVLVRSQGCFETMP